MNTVEVDVELLNRCLALVQCAAMDIPRGADGEAIDELENDLMAAINQE